jgi:hypothetical protein
MIPAASPSTRGTEPRKSATQPHRRTLSKRRVRRAFYSFWAVIVVLTIGALGFHFIAGLDPVDSLYFECMLATGQGPPLVLTADSAKLFASAMAFLSVGTVLTTLVLNFGPIMGQLWREGVEHAERELRKVEEEVADEFKGRNHRP